MPRSEMWKQNRQKFEAETMGRPAIQVWGRHGMVSSMHPDATAAGVDILRAGGNAVDAAIAVAAAISVTNHHWSGLAGDSAWLIRWAESGEILHLDGYGTCPTSMTAAALARRVGLEAGTPAAALREEPAGFRDAGLPVAIVPGTPAALHAAWQRFGRIPMPELLHPAIALAQVGVPVSRYLAQSLTASREKIGKFESSRRIFFKGDEPLGEGDTIVQGDLAETLERYTRDPAGEFANGETARAIVRQAKAQRAFLTAGDLAGYQPNWRSAVKGSYRGREVWVSAPPTAGIHLLQALGILDRFDLSGMGYHAPETLHLQIEAVKLALADRRKCSGDPDFVTVPIAALLDRDYAARLAATIQPDASCSHGAASASLGNETTHFVVVDSADNVVSATQTIGSDYGCGEVVEGTGLVMNDRTWWMRLDSGANQVAPGRRASIGHAPAIVFEDSRPWISLGSPGGFGIVSYLVQTLVNTLDHGLDLQEAIEAPRFRVNDLAHAVGMEDRFDLDTLGQLRAWGHEIELYPAWTDRVGGVEGVARDLVHGNLLGGYDSRRNSLAAGY